jgi:hypothetical protein
VLCNSSHDLRCHPKETNPFSNKYPSWFNEFFVIWQQSEVFYKSETSACFAQKATARTGTGV